VTGIGGTMNITLKVWRQAGAKAAGALVEYKATDVSPDMSFLEMLDVVNEGLIGRGEVPIAFDHDCREGICGMCGVMINGVAHGPMKGTATCQLHMRSFRDGDTIVIEPWRASAFPVIKDLVVDRGAFDRIIQAGGYVSVATGGAKDANTIPVPKTDADSAMDAAACIGCGACVAACPNASASLFTSAKISHLGLLPQGQPERYRRALKMVAQMDLESFGGCTLFGECQEACPKSISIDFIGRMNRDYMHASVTAVEERAGGGEG
jgi:succinate dehydrogenase / fumarate reductase iron-sulfur subunit